MVGVDPPHDPLKAVVGVDQHNLCIYKVSKGAKIRNRYNQVPHLTHTYAYTKALLGNNSVSSHSCHFVKKKFESNSFMHMFNVSILYRQSIKLLHPKLW